jgi:hypothetical protein
MHKPSKNSKKIVSSSSSDASHSKTPPPLNKNLFTTCNCFEALNQNQNDTPDIDLGTTFDQKQPNDAIHIKLLPRYS